MSIDFTGHCAFPMREAQRRIDYLVRNRPDLYRDTHKLTDAQRLGPFGAEIAREFGIEAECVFSLHLLSSDWIEHSREAVELIYEVFGTERLVVTYGMDSVRVPLRDYPPMDI